MVGYIYDISLKILSSVNTRYVSALTMCALIRCTI